ncbi:MAG TPA: spore cortex-lytic enzyme, partial [Clostridia bacterium]|nr:spore cortex-lytic enzyme [Clostridia bacterium]
YENVARHQQRSSKNHQRLSNMGLFTGTINGEFDLNTISAVRKFQEENSLEVSGTADKYTMIALGMTRMGQTGVAYAEGNSVGDTQLLARAINGEARGEPYEGQVAVGAVILNRTRDPRFPKTIAGVIYQPGAFTAVDDGQINTPLDPNSTVVKAANDALNGWDPTNGCVYYWNPATATSKWIWSRQIVAQIGKHYFGK